MLSSRATRRRNTHSRLVGHTVRLSRGTMAWRVLSHNPARSVYTLESLHTLTRHCEPSAVLHALISANDLIVGDDTPAEVQQ